LLYAIQAVIVSAASTLAALGVIAAAFRRPLRQLRASLTQADILLNGRPEERASWDDSRLLVASIKPAAQRLDAIEASVEAIRVEVTPNGGGSMRDAVLRIERRLTDGGL
jgi:hypothetical protein